MFNKNKKKTYGIVGIGRFGFALANELANSDCELIVLDSDEEKIHQMRELTENTYVIKSFDEKTLLETGIQNCDVAIVCIGEHLDASILTTLNLVSMNIPTVISKATSIEQGIILEKLGAHVIYPERDMALRLAKYLENPNVLDYMRLNEKVTISKILVPKQLIGKKFVDIDFRTKFGLNIIAIENRGNVTENMKSNYKFKKNDMLYFIGNDEGIKKLIDWNNT